MNNAISMPYAKGFGWGAELNLENVYENLFKAPFGGGYPKERVIPEQRNKKILDGIKEKTYRPLIDILNDIDKDFLLETVDRPTFRDLFFKNAKDEALINYFKNLLK